METVVEECEKQYGIPEGHTLIMAAIESARGVMKALDICEASERMFGIALSGGDYTKDLQTHITGTGLELMGARQNMIIAARAAGVQCFDTVYTNLDDMDGFRRDVETIHLMGFDGKSIINPRQINIDHLAVYSEYADTQFLLFVDLLNYFLSKNDKRSRKRYTGRDPGDDR